MVSLHVTTRALPVVNLVVLKTAFRQGTLIHSEKPHSLNGAFLLISVDSRLVKMTV